ncbi:MULTISPECIES: tetratricopeptide repeat protein [Streptomyces]|uniref:tetratricopeptide repeat protein n=1 Tax=Streptomyces TaxID=1883 RepID=UPI000B870AFF|nr:MULTISPECIES: sel1 repeat family protein [unclassified Streptomyces]MYT18325.1 hypothetical protein [Streptomyces sp. SID4951]
MTDESGSSAVGDRVDTQRVARAAAGDVEEIFRLANDALRRRDLDSATEWLERAAATGNAQAMHWRANLAYKLRNDDTAFVWWDRAGAAGRTRAWRDAAVRATHLFDLARAGDWWQKLAATGDGEAMYHLAIIALNRNDDATGEHWLQRAADTGHADAMFTLGNRLCEAGDHDGARRWWVAAMAAGSADALDQLIAKDPPAHVQRSVQAALAAVNSSDLYEIYRLAGRWDGQQLAIIANHYDALGNQSEQILYLHLVLGTRDQLGTAEQRFIDDAVSLDANNPDFPTRWAHALGLAHRDHNP